MAIEVVNNNVWIAAGKYIRIYDTEGSYLLGFDTGIYDVMAIEVVPEPTTITCSQAAWNTPDYGDGVVTVSYVATGNDVRAFAFDVNAVDSVSGSRKFATDIAVITSITRLDPDYFIHPGSTRLKDPGATIQKPGQINAAPSYPGTLPGLGTDVVTTEQASLYVGAPNSPGGAGAGSSGDLFKFVVDANCTIEIRENAIRGGVVMEDLDEDPALTGAGGVLCSCEVNRICWGDIAGDFGSPGANDKVNLGDLFMVVNEMNAQYPSGDDAIIYQLLEPPPVYSAMDVAADNFGLVLGQNGKINIGDLFVIVNAMNAAYPTGDPTFMYNIGCQ
jgi:hypothetical protein